MYSLVARGKTVLADGAPASVTGNYEVVSRLLLTKLAEQHQGGQAQTSAAAAATTTTTTSGDAETEPLKGAAATSTSRGGAAATGSSNAAPSGGRLFKFENGSDFTFYVHMPPVSFSSSSQTQGGGRGGGAAGSGEPLVFLCLCEAAAPARVAFAFLGEVKERFTSSYKPAEWEQAIAYSFNAEFSGVLSAQMQRFNGDGATDERVRRVREQLDDLKDVMVKNIDALLNRGEALDILVEKTDRMQQAAFKFESRAQQAAQLMWWKKVRCRIGAALFALLFVFFILMAGCGGLDFSKCSR